MRTVDRLCSVLALCVTVGCAGIHPHRINVTPDRLEASLGTRYYSLYVQGNRVGWTSMSLHQATDSSGAARYVTSRELWFLFAGGLAYSEREINDFDARPPFGFRRGSLSSTLGGTHEMTTVSRQDGTDLWVSTTHADDEIRARHVSDFDYRLEDVLTPQWWIREPRLDPERLLTRGLSLDSLTIFVESRELDPEASSQFIRTVIVEDLSTGDRYTESYDANGTLLNGKVDCMEYHFDVEQNVRTGTFKQLLTSLPGISVDTALGQPETIAHLVMDLISPREVTINSNSRQSVSRIGNVTRIRLGALSAPPAASTEERAQNLIDSGDVPLSSPEVQRLATEAVGDASSPGDKLERLVQFTNTYIKPVEQDSSLALSELLHFKQGDCSEFALLLTTLARASGLPARNVSGLVYDSDGGHRFCGHAWNEVLIDNSWISVDASRNQLELDPTHIALDDFGLLDLLIDCETSHFQVIKIDRRQPVDPGR